MQLNDRVVAITQDEFVPGVIDQILDSNVLTARLFNNHKKWNGESMVVPIISAKNANGGSFGVGDTFSTGVEANTKKLRFYPKAYYQNVTIDGIEKAANSTPAQQARLVAVQMETAQNSMVDSLGTILYGDGTGNSGKNFDGLKAIVDDGTTVTTYGGLTRASNTYLNASVTTAVGTLALSNIRAALRNAAAASSAKSRPNLAITTELIWDSIENLFPAAAARYETRELPRITATGNTPAMSEMELRGATGYTALFFKAIPIVADDLTPAGELYLLNENHQAYYWLADNDLEKVKKPSAVQSTENEAGSGVDNFAPIQWTGFQKPVNGYSMTGQLLTLGNVISNKPRRNARLAGITG